MGSGTEHATALTLSNLPEGATLSYGNEQPDGSWSLDLAHLNDTQLLLPSDWQGDAALTVNATVQDGAAAPVAVAAGVALHVDAVASTPSLAVQDADGVAGAPIALTVAASGDASDHLSVIVQNVPLDATLSAGISDGLGNWVLSTQDLAGLNYQPPAAAAGDVALNVWVHAIEPTNGAVADTQQTLNLHIAPDPLHGLEHLITPLH